MKKKLIQILTVCFVVLTTSAIAAYKLHYEPVQNIVTKTDTPKDHAEIVASTVKLTGKSQNTPNKDFQQLTTKQIESKPVVYILFKTGCENCQKLFPIIEKQINQLPETIKARVYYINSMSTLGQELKGKYNIKTNTAAILETDDQTETKIYSLKHSDRNAETSLTDIFNSLRYRAN